MVQMQKQEIQLVYSQVAQNDFFGSALLSLTYSFSILFGDNKMQNRQDEILVFEEKQDNIVERGLQVRVEERQQKQMELVPFDDQSQKDTNQYEPHEILASPKFALSSRQQNQQLQQPNQVHPEAQCPPEQANIVFVEQNAYSFRKDELSRKKENLPAKDIEVISDFNSQVQKNEGLLQAASSSSFKSRRRNKFKDINDQNSVKSNKILQKYGQSHASKSLIPNILNKKEQEEINHTEDHLTHNKTQVELVQSISPVRSRKQQKALPPLNIEKAGQIVINTSNILANQSSMVVLNKRQDESKLTITNMSSLTQMINQSQNLKRISEKVVPKGKTLKCIFQRQKQCFLNYCTPQYSLHFKNKKFILNAKKELCHIGSHYIITSSEKEYSRDSEYNLGYLSGNLVGSCFNLYQSLDGVDDLVCTIVYETELTCSPAFRKVEIYIKNSEDRSLYGADQNRGYNLKQLYSLGQNAKGKRIVKLINKIPEWNEQLGCYSMNLKGKCKMGSVKNSVLVSQDEPQRYILLFCKTDKNQFYTQLSHPLSPFISMGIILSSFDFKLFCQ